MKRGSSYIFTSRILSLTIVETQHYGMEIFDSEGKRSDKNWTI